MSLCDKSSEIFHFFNGGTGMWNLDSCWHQARSLSYLQELTSDAKLELQQYQLQVQDINPPLRPTPQETITI